MERRICLECEAGRCLTCKGEYAAYTRTWPCLCPNHPARRMAELLGDALVTPKPNASSSSPNSPKL
jgi:hypothetical protein